MTFSGVFQTRILDHNTLFFDVNNLPSNVIQYKESLIFTQRKLDKNSVKAMVKQWKKYVKRLAHFEKQEFIDNLNAAYAN